MALYEVRIEPLEPVLFGDNRSARAGFDHLQRDQDPSPLTLHGAIGQFLAGRSGTWPAHLLGDRESDILKPESRVAELLGYSLRGPEGNLYFPRPRHLRCTLGDGAPVAKDLLTPGDRNGAKASPAWPLLLFPADDEPLDEEAEGEVLLTESALEKVLRGEVPRDGARFPSGLFLAEPRPGIAMNNEAGTVFEGAFFTRPYRRFKLSASTAPAGFTAWFQTLAPLRLDTSAGIGFLGGDRRRARFEFREAGPVALNDLCERVAEAAAEEESRGFLLYLLTPALVREAPTSPARLSARAAALGKPAYASGWDVQRNRPRPVHTLIPAGSVYFFDWPPDAPLGPVRADLVRNLWLKPLDEKDEGAAAGFGRCLPGIWR